MNAEQHSALAAVIRRTIAADMDALCAEVDQLRRQVADVDRLRRQVQALEQLAGAGSLPRRERIARAAQLRTSGLSLRAIAATLNVNRATVARDLEALGVAPPSLISGLDGRRTRGPRVRPSP